MIDLSNKNMKIIVGKEIIDRKNLSLNREETKTNQNDNLRENKR
jgi:hypothetical protein